MQCLHSIILSGKRNSPVIAPRRAGEKISLRCDFLENFLQTVNILPVAQRFFPRLWHCFSSQVKQDSERFLAIVRLNLYLKKNLRPILERYLEEPNIWNTWNKIWLEVKPILDACVDGDAMSEYTWMGDQDANSYSELSVNNEQDVRQGKYKAILKYKDIVPMQEVTMSIIIDQASKSVSIVENE